MYKTMNDAEGLDGFSLKTSDDDDHVKFTCLWRDLIDVNKGLDRWPAPSSNPISYTFELLHGLNPVVDFDWYDYRGGAINGLSGEPDVIDLKARLKQTSCVVVCISAEHLCENAGPLENEHMAIGSIARFISGAGYDKDYPPAIVIAVTKIDVDNTLVIKELIKRVKSKFAPLFTGGTLRWMVMICPITLGRELSGSQDNGKIKPENVHLPILFPLLCEMLKQKWKLDDKLDGQKDTLVSLQSGILSFFNRKVISEKEKDIEAINEEVQKMAKDIILLVRKMKSSSAEVGIFLNGEPLNGSFYDYFL
jgi:hypothetical protein